MSRLMCVPPSTQIYKKKKKKNQNNLLSMLGTDEACIPSIATQGVLCSRL